MFPVLRALFLFVLILIITLPVFSSVVKEEFDYLAKKNSLLEKSAVFLSLQKRLEDLEKKPDDNMKKAEEYIILAELYRHLKSSEFTIRNLKKAYDIVPEKKRAFVSLEIAREYYKANNLQMAGFQLKKTERLLKEYPDKDMLSQARQLELNVRYPQIATYSKALESIVYVLFRYYDSLLAVDQIERRKQIYMRLDMDFMQCDKYIEQAKGFIKDMPDDKFVSSLLLNIAIIYNYNLEDRKKALHFYDEAIKKGRSSEEKARAYLLKGIFFVFFSPTLTEVDVNKALLCFEQVLKLLDGRQGAEIDIAYLLTGVMLEKKAKYREAIETYRIMSGTCSEVFQHYAVFRIGRIYQNEFKDQNNAILFYKLVIKNAPGSRFAEPARIAISTIDSSYFKDPREGIIARAYELYEQKKYRESAEEYMKIVKTDTKGKKSDDIIKNAYLRASAIYCYDLLDYGQGIEVLREFSIRFPDDDNIPQIFFQIADWSEYLLNYNQAEEYYRKILSRHRDSQIYTRAGINLANMFEDKLNQPKKSVEIFEELLRQAPDNNFRDEIRFKAALLYQEKLKNSKRAIELFNLCAGDPASRFRASANRRIYQIVSQDKKNTIVPSSKEIVKTEPDIKPDPQKKEIKDGSIDKLLEKYTSRSVVQELTGISIELILLENPDKIFNNTVERFLSLDALDSEQAIVLINSSIVYANGTEAGKKLADIFIDGDDVPYGYVRKARLLRAIYYLRQGMDALARKEVDLIIDKQNYINNSDQELFIYGLLLLEKQNPDIEWIRIVKNRIIEKPVDHISRFWLAFLFEKLKNLEFINRYNEFLSRYPNSKKYNEVLFKKAVASANYGNISDARKILFQLSSYGKQFSEFYKARYMLDELDFYYELENIFNAFVESSSISDRLAYQKRINNFFQTKIFNYELYEMLNTGLLQWYGQTSDGLSKDLIKDIKKHIDIFMESKDQTEGGDSLYSIAKLLEESSPADSLRYYEHAINCISKDKKIDCIINASLIAEEKLKNPVKALQLIELADKFNISDTRLLKKRAELKKVLGYADSEIVKDLEKLHGKSIGKEKEQASNDIYDLFVRSRLRKLVNERKLYFGTARSEQVQLKIIDIYENEIKDIDKTGAEYEFFVKNYPESNLIRPIFKKLISYYEGNDEDAKAMESRGKYLEICAEPFEIDQELPEFLKIMMDGKFYREVKQFCDRNLKNTSFSKHYALLRERLKESALKLKDSKIDEDIRGDIGKFIDGFESILNISKMISESYSEEEINKLKTIEKDIDSLSAETDAKVVKEKIIGISKKIDVEVKNYEKATELYQYYFDNLKTDFNSQALILRCAEITEKELNDREKSLEYYQMYVERFSETLNTPKILYKIAMIYMEELKDYEKARDYFIDIKQDHQESEFYDKAIFRLAENYTNNYSEYETAIGLYEELIRYQYESDLADDAQYRIGAIYEKYLRDYNKAIESYRLVIRNYSNSNYNVNAQDAIFRIQDRHASVLNPENRRQ